jgi:hypothetical protein
MKLSYAFVLLWFIAGFSCFATAVTQEQPQPDQNPLFINISLEEKRSIKKEFLNEMMARYNQNQTFLKMHEYMVSKYQELGKTASPVFPDTLIEDTLNRSRQVFDKTQPLVGNSFKKVYDPERIEKAINKYLWLKGLCFFVLGIKEEHKIALSYFYLPGNEQVKLQFLKDAVQYSYPEVLDVPENNAWFTSMSGVMERLGYKLFNIDKYCPENKLTTTGRI